MKTTVLAAAVLAVLATPPAVSARAPEKFAAWFPILSDGTFGSVSDGECNATLLAYRTAYDERAPSLDQAAACAAQQRCILENLRADIAARMASASVLLGLTPGLLASLGPTVAEISLLSTERPLLSLLLSFGSPAVAPSRVLKYENALDMVRGADNRAHIPSFRWLRQSPGQQRLVSATQYLLAAAATANVLYTSFELGVRTSMTFRCVNSYFPIVWTLLPFGVYLPAALALNWGRWRNARARARARARTKAKEHRKESQEDTETRSAWRAAWHKETALCLVHAPTPLGRVAESVPAVSLNYLATFLGFLHVTFGILIFSSLIFIEVIDVVTVLLRYMTSSVVCRAVLSFELAGIRATDEGSTDGDGGGESAVLQDVKQPPSEGQTTQSRSLLEGATS